MNLRREKWKVLVIVVVVVAIGTAAGVPSWMLHKSNLETENAFVLQSFYQQIGADTQETQIIRVTEGVYMASWLNDNTIHVAWGIGGLWVEIFRQELETPSGQVPLLEE